MEKCIDCKYFIRFGETSERGDCENQDIKNYIEGFDFEAFCPEINFGCIKHEKIKSPENAV
jgi:hypothetical protein